MTEDRRRDRRRPKKDGKKDPHNHDLFVRLVGKAVRVELYDGLVVSGKMDYVARYEVQLTEEGGTVNIIPKHAILRATKES